MMIIARWEENSEREKKFNYEFLTAAHTTFEMMNEFLHIPFVPSAPLHTTTPPLFSIHECLKMHFLKKILLF